MAMTFNASGCRETVENLKTSGSNLDKLLNNDLNSEIAKVKNNYHSATADELYAMHDKMKAKFPEFIDAVNRCSDYLSNTVAPAYDKVKRETANKINGGV